MVDGENNSFNISVIMAVHNEAASLIIEAVQSILKQTMSSFELIICNDASNESILKLLEELVETDERMVLISNEKNEFAGKTRNKGIRMAQGQYIAIMDADDFSYPERLQVQYDFLESNPQYAFVCSDTAIFDGINVLPSPYHLKRSPQKEDFLWNMPFIHPTAMIKKKCIEQVGGYSTDHASRRAEDYDLFMKLYSAGFKGYNLEKVLYRYYVNPEQMKKKRLYRYRIDEMYIRARNFKELGLLPRGIPYIVKPLLVGLIPHQLLWRMKKS